MIGEAREADPVALILEPCKGSLVSSEVLARSVRKRDGGHVPLLDTK